MTLPYKRYAYRSIDTANKKEPTTYGSMENTEENAPVQLKKSWLARLIDLLGKIKK